MPVQPRNNTRNQRSRCATTKVLLPPIASDILGRTTGSDNNKFPRGATATTYAFGTAAQCVKGHIRSGDLTVLAGTPESQSLKIRRMDKTPDVLTLNYFADTEYLSNIIGSEGNPGDGEASMTATLSAGALRNKGPLGFATNSNNNYLSTLKRFKDVTNTSALPKGLVIGCHSVELGAPLTLGEAFASSQSLTSGSYFVIEDETYQGAPPTNPANMFSNGAYAYYANSAAVLTAMSTLMTTRQGSTVAASTAAAVATPADTNGAAALTAAASLMGSLAIDLALGNYNVGAGHVSRSDILDAQTALLNMAEPTSDAAAAALKDAEAWIAEAIAALDAATKLGVLDIPTYGNAYLTAVAGNFGVPTASHMDDYIGGTVMLPIALLQAAYSTHDSVPTLLSEVYSYPTVTLDVPSYDETPCMVVTIKKDTLWPGETIIRRLSDNEYLSYGDEDDCHGNMEDYLVKKNDGLIYFAKDFELDFSKYTVDVPLQLISGAGGNVLCIPAETRLDIDIHLSAELGKPQALTPIQPQSSSIPADVATMLSAGSLLVNLAIGTRTGLTVVESHDVAIGSNVLTLDGTDRDIPPFAHQVLLPAHSYLECGELIVGDLAVLPQAFEMGSESHLTEVLLNVTATTPTATPDTVRRTPLATYVRDVVTLDHPIISHEFIVQGDARIFNIIATSELLSVPPSSYARTPQQIIPSSRWECPVFFEEAVISAGHVAQSWIDFLCDHLTQQDIELARGSRIAAGSILAENTITPANIKCTNDITFESGTSVDSCLSTGPLDIVIPLVNQVPAPVPLSAGTIIKAGVDDRSERRSRSDRSSLSASESVIDETILPAGMQITNGNRMPVCMKILPTENVTLNEGLVLRNPVFGPGFQMSNLQFEEGYEFPPNTVMMPGVILPPGTELPKGHRFPFPFAYPVGHRIPAGSKLQPGMVFSAGSNLPSILLRPQDDGLRASIAAYNDVPFVLVTTGAPAKTYIVWRAGTVFQRGTILPKGFTLLAQSGFGTSDGNYSVYVTGAGNPAAFTAAVGSPSAWVTTADTVDLDAAEISFDGHQRALLDFTLTVGVPLTQPISLKNELRVPYDCVMQFSDSTSLLSSVLSAVDFVIAKEASLDRDFFVGDDGEVLQPAMAILQMDMTLTSEMRITAQTTLIKKVRLPVNNGCEYIESVLEDSNAHIRLPNVVNVTNKNFRITPGSAGLVIGTGTFDSKAYIELPKGTLVNLVAGYYQLKSDVTLTQNWCLETDITVYPGFPVVDMVIPAGGQLPSEVVIPAGNALPAGMSTAKAMTLAYDYIVRDDSFLVKADSTLAAGSRLERDSRFPAGTEATAFKYGPVCFWRETATFYLFPGSLLPVMKYNYYDDFGSYDFDVNNSKELNYIMDALKLLDQHPHSSSSEEY